MLSEEQRRKNIYAFFKEKMNVDLSTFSEEKLSIFAKEINLILDEQIEVERKRNIELTEALKKEYETINLLTQEYYGN